jgi:hypothetical protein
MLYLETLEGFSPWKGEPINGILHPRDIEQKWTASELAAVGLFAPLDPGVPADKTVVGSHVARVEDVVQWIYDLENSTVSVLELHAERDRRLGLGFDYDFGDARGVHHIDTTPADMIGWDEVSKLASALLALGQTTPITIATGTGVTQVTPLEWQMVMLAAAAYRQPIWGASFIISAMDPLPTNFTNDAYWGITIGTP